MGAISKRQIGALFLSFSCALLPATKACSYELATSDMAAYRADVVRRIFDAVKNSSEYKRTVIDLNITAMGKITSCRIVKSSGNLDLDAAMMKALSQVYLEPMKFASSTSDAIQVQLCFGNAIPDAKNLYVGENESFAYRSFGTLLNISGGTPSLEASPTGSAVANGSAASAVISTANRRRIAHFTNTHFSTDEIAPLDPPVAYSSSDKSYDAEIEKLLIDSPREMVFRSLNFNALETLPPSSLQVDRAKAFVAKGKFLSAAQAYIMALIQPIKSGEVESTAGIIDKLSKLNPSLRGDDRLNVATSLLNLYQRMRSLQYRLKGTEKTAFTSSVDALLPVAQQFAENSSTKHLGRLARYYRMRGDIFQQVPDSGKAKIAYQKYLSITLENEDAQPAEVEQAFDKALDVLQSREDQFAVDEVEKQRQVWMSKHPDPTNLRAIATACKKLELGLFRNPINPIADGAHEEEMERIASLIRSSTLYTSPLPDLFSPSADGYATRVGTNQKEDVNRCLQSLQGVNDRLATYLRSTRSPAIEQLFRETYIFALRTHYDQQMRSFQRLADYLVLAGKAQEALVLCDLVGTIADTEEVNYQRFPSPLPIEQLRLRALLALDRNAEAEQLEGKLAEQSAQKTQANSKRNIEFAEQRLVQSLPLSSERIRARGSLVGIYLESNSPEQIQKAKALFLESLSELGSEKFISYSVSDYRYLSSQLSSLIPKLAEPDLDFATKALDAHFKLQRRNATSSTPNVIAPAERGALLEALDRSVFAKRPKIYMELIRDLIRLSREPARQDPDGMLLLLRKLAALESKVGENENAMKTNSEIVNLLEKQQSKDHTELVRQLISLATSEAASGKSTLARKHQQQAADLKFQSKDPTGVSTSLVELANVYARKGDLKGATSALLDAIKQPNSAINTQNPVSARELIRACEQQKNFQAAKDYLVSAIDFEQGRNASSAVLSLYRVDLSELLLKEYSASTSSSQKTNLLKQSNDTFQTAADGLSSAQGESSKLLGGAVQRRAFLLALSGLTEQGDALLEKYKAAAANSGGGNLVMDANVGSPPQQQ